jgi:xylan 1,4-beta-xylosidase
MARAPLARSVESALSRPGKPLQVALAALLAAFVAMPARAAAPPPVLTAQATVDFARPVATHSLVGFLHGISDAQPDDRMVVPLHPTLWRGSLASAPYARTIGFGAQYMVVISDLWGYPGAGWYGRQAPWEDWDAWSDFVRDLARRNRDRNIVWDVWNEPDTPYFWTGTEAQYHELYRRAYVAIREELGPSAEIAGPSVGTFRWDWLARLLEYCRSADCGVDALSWHELPGGRGVASIATHLRRARAGLLNNPAYVPLGVRELYIGEYVGEGDALWAGEVLGYLSQLEQGGASEAAHACWHDPSGEDNCAAHTLDGLLDGATMRPRAPWWALRWYGRGAGSRVRSESADPAFAVLASRAPDPRHAEVVLGYLDTHDRALPASTDALVDLRGLRSLRFLHNTPPRITAYRVRSRGQAPATPVAVHAPDVVQSARGRLVVRVHRLGMHDAMLLRLSAPPRRATRSAAAAGARGALREVECFVDPAAGAPSQGCTVARGMAATHRAVLSPDGRNLYAPSSFDWGVVAFRRDARTGRLRQLPGARGCLSSRPTPGCTRARGMVWAFWATASPDGRNVYVSGGIGNSIAILRRDPPTGALSQPAGEAGCVRNRRGGASQGGPGPGEDGCRQVDGLRYPRTLALSPDGRFLYAAAFGSDAIVAFARDPLTGALAPTEPSTPALNGVTDLALSRDGRFLYATAYDAGAVSAFARDAASGRLTPIGCIADSPRGGCTAGRGLRGAFNLALSPDGRSLYVVARHSGSLTTFDVDPATGGFEQKAAGDGCRSATAEPGCRVTIGLRGARGVTVAPDGRNVYTGAFWDSVVGAFARVAGGRLRRLPGRLGCVAAGSRPAGCTRGRGVRQAWGVTVSSDGRFAYVGVGGDHNSGLAVFARDGGLVE